MAVLDKIANSVKVIARIVRAAAELQEPQRQRVVQSLEGICSRCEDSFTEISTRLKPVRDAYQDRTELVLQLREFCDDKNNPKIFKPSNLCGEIGQLLIDLQSWLNPLGYSWDVFQLCDLQRSLGHIGELDKDVFEEFYQFTKALRRGADEIEAAATQDWHGPRDGIRRIVDDYLDDLEGTVRQVRDIKDNVLN